MAFSSPPSTDSGAKLTPRRSDMRALMICGYEASGIRDAAQIDPSVMLVFNRLSPFATTLRAITREDALALAAAGNQPATPTMGAFNPQLGYMMA
jgi:hypothetical protein